MGGGPDACRRVATGNGDWLSVLGLASQAFPFHRFATGNRQFNCGAVACDSLGRESEDRRHFARQDQSRSDDMKHVARLPLGNAMSARLRLLSAQPRQSVEDRECPRRSLATRQRKSNTPIFSSLPSLPAKHPSRIVILRATPTTASTALIVTLPTSQTCANVYERFRFVRVAKQLRAKLVQLA